MYYFVCCSGSFSSGSPYLFVVSGTAFRSLHMLGFGFGSRLFKVLIILGPGQFLAPGARFEGRVLLAVRDRFWLREPALKEEFNYISGPGPFWLREPGLKEECH